MKQSTAFWETLKTLAAQSPIVIDRPAGSQHPRYPDCVYPLNYGYLEGTTASDGNGIDVWVGSLAQPLLTGILCTFDQYKHDAEIKLLLGCTAEEVQTILDFSTGGLAAYFVQNPISKEQNEHTS